jgi:hypothetical protein
MNKNPKGLVCTIKNRKGRNGQIFGGTHKYFGGTSRSVVLNPNYSATCFFPLPLILGHWTAKTSPVPWDYFTVHSTPILSTKDIWWIFQVNCLKKIFLLTMFVSVKQRNFFLVPQIACDPFKIFYDPLPGRDPLVEKHCSRFRRTQVEKHCTNLT